MWEPFLPDCFKQQWQTVWVTIAGLRCFLWLKHTQSDFKHPWGITSQLHVHSAVWTQLHLLWLQEGMAKMGKLNPWESATRVQSSSQALWLHRVCAGCISTKHLHCMRQFDKQSKHNLLLTNLQLKYIKLVGGYLQSKNVAQYEALCWNIVLARICFSCSQTSFTLFVLPEKSAHSSFLPWSLIQPLAVLQTPSYKGHVVASVGTAKSTGSSHLLPQQWNSPSFMGEKGEQQEAGKQSIPLKDLFSNEKYLHLKICFSEQTRLSLIAECCCFVQGSPRHSEKRLTSSYSYPASPPPCLFWPVFQTFSRFLSLTQAEFLVSESGTSPWEQLLENKPPNKANLYKQVKWCLNYYKYYPGYNRAEFICPFVTMKQIPRNVSQELPYLLNPFFAISWPGCWQQFQTSAGKLPSCSRTLIQFSQGQPSLETLKKASGIFEKTTF